MARQYGSPIPVFSHERQGLQLTLVRVSPEEYTVAAPTPLGPQMIASIRLRDGVLVAWTPTGKLIYQAIPKGQGMFLDARERTLYLNKACKEIVKYHDRQDTDG